MKTFETQRKGGSRGILKKQSALSSQPRNGMDANKKNLKHRGTE
jgi:hypothetical protein